MLLRPRPAGSRSAGFFTAHRAVELALLRPERWCERGDSNPHPLRDQILSLARLPNSATFAQFHYKASRPSDPVGSEVSAERRLAR